MRTQNKGGFSGLRHGLVLVAISTALQGLAFARPDLSHAGICDAAAFGCPASGTCTIIGSHEIEDGCTLDFGARQVMLKGTLRADLASGSFDVLADSLSLENGRMLSRGAGDDAGGDITIVLSGAFTMSGASPLIDVGGDAGGGTIDVTASSISLLSGSIEANGGSGEDCGDAGSISLLAESGALASSATLSATTPAIDCAGGTIALEGASIQLARNASVTGGNNSFGEILVTATEGDLVVTSAATLSASGRGMDDGSGGDGGQITLDAQGSVLVDGVLEATGSAPSASGGTVTIQSGAEAGSIDLRKRIDVTGKGDGYAGDVTIRAEGDVTVAASGTIAADAGLGFIDIQAPGTAAFLGNASVTAAGGSDAGRIEIAACTVVVGGLLDARLSGAGASGENLVRGGSIHLLGTARLLAQACPGGGCNRLRLRAGAPVIDSGALIAPAATIETSDDVTTCCGNETIDPGETCDDGNGLHCDGCTPACEEEAPDPCADDGNSCTGTTCIPAVGCEPLHGASCDDDGDPCTEDVCAGTECLHRACEDTGDSCRVGACTSSGCEITELPDGAACFVGSLESTCEDGACLNPCDDGDPCTTDQWAGFCLHVDGACPSDCTGAPDDMPCSDGLVCTTGRCRDQTCVPEPVTCDPCAGEISTCIEGFGLQCWQAGPPVTCADDGNPCTAGYCDSETGACVHGPLTGTACPDDGSSCTSDVCDAGACIHLATGCDDGNACTADSCEPDGTCRHDPIACDDGNPCTADACDPGAGCTSAPISCDDGDPCTEDTCDPSSGCESTPVCEQPLDAFTCYRALTTPGTARLTPIAGVGLEDALGAATVDVKKSVALCAPTDVAGADPTAPSHADHLAGFQIKASPGSARFVKRTSLGVTSSLGTITVDAVARDGLLVPSAKDLVIPPAPPSAPNPDSFECYRVRVSRGTPAFVPVPGVVLTDQLGSQAFDVKKPVRLCNPASVSGGDPSAPGHPARLLCYRIKASPGAPRFARVSPVHVASELGDESLDLTAVKELCLPATVSGP